MISSRTGKDPVISKSPALTASKVSLPLRPHFSSPHRTSGHILNCTLCRLPLHLRAAFRLLRRRHTLAYALLAGSAATAGAVAASVAAVSHYSIAAMPLPGHRASVSALKTAQLTPAKPKRHLLAAALHSHPLRGLASWYGSVLHGHKTASGEIFHEAELTAAHRTLPFGTLVRVTDLRSLRSVIVRINDRGTLAPGRVIDLSAAAADRLGILRSGIASVKLEILERPEKA